MYASSSFEASAHCVDCGGHLGELSLRAALGGEGGELALEQPADLVELTDVRLLEVEKQVERAVELVAGLGDGEQAGVAVLDQALRLEHAQRLADRGAADPQRLCELSFGRQHVSGGEPPLADLVEEVLGDELVDLLAGDRRGLGHLPSVTSGRVEPATPR